LSIRDLIGLAKPASAVDAGRSAEQDEAPIVEALQTYLKADPTSFDVPGHQSGRRRRTT
jgi:hypothetical protein